MKQKIKKAVFYSTWLIKFSFLTCFYLVVSLPLRFSKKYKDLWIIGERPDEARDNGYWLYKWIIKNKPETNVRFVLAKNSVDYEKMPRKDLIIEPGSAQHYICWILSSYSVSTHMHGACPGKSFCIPFLPFVRRKKTVFLQHGITTNAVKFRGGLDVITAASEAEKELIEKYNQRYTGKVKVTGFCRYDNLTDLSQGQKEKIILVMPTFRKWLRDIGRLKNADEVFKGTNYYKTWNSFLASPELKTMLDKNNMKVIFFPHNEMQKLAHNFVTSNDRIVIGKQGEYDVQDLLRRSSVLITDYSSVLFDFTYMDKPVLFYQFDREEFYSKHYSATGKSYPFGRTVVNESSLDRELEYILKTNFEIASEFLEEITKFYTYRDDKNCERVYNLIEGLK